jgi:hypothetical protein
MLVKGWLFVAPITGIPTLILSYIQPDATLASSFMTAGLVLLIMMANVVFVLGLFLVNPVFSEKSAKIWLNVVLVIIVQVILFIVSLFVLTNFGKLDEPIGGFQLMLLTQATLSWISGFGLLMIGKGRLNRID